MSRLLTTYTTLLTAVVICTGKIYKPVFLKHGVGSGAFYLDYLAYKIREAHPNTIIHNSVTYQNLSSLTPLKDQINGDLGQEFLNFSRHHKDGFHFVGHSQGSILGRGLIQTYPEHNVKNFISLGGPMLGVYGATAVLFGIVLPTNVTSAVFYNTEIQRSISVANYWNDPRRHDLYLKYNEFLPYMDNEIRTNKSEMYKKGFTKCTDFFLMGGPDDGVIVPWFSSQFSYMDEHENPIHFKDHRMYKEDWFGLRTVDEQNKLHFCTISGVEHMTYPFNDEVIETCVLPYLD